MIRSASRKTGGKSPSTPLAVTVLAFAMAGAAYANGPRPVGLGTAGAYAILTKTGISTVPPSTVTGNIAASPVAATYLTGFSMTEDATNVFWTSNQVIGKAFAADNAVPSPSNLTVAVLDMEAAYTDAAGRPTPLRAWLLVARAAGSALVGGPLGRSLMVRQPLRVASDGDEWADQAYLTLLAGTVPSIGLGFRALSRAGEQPGFFHAVGVHGALAQVVRLLPRVHRGAPWRRRAALDVVARVNRLTSVLQSRMPSMCEPVPSATLPATCQNMFLACAPPARMTCLTEARITFPVVWKIHTSLGPPERVTSSLMVMPVVHL